MCVSTFLACFLCQGDRDFCQCKPFKCQLVPHMSVCVCPCQRDILKSLCTHVQVLIWSFICGFETCFSWCVCKLCTSVHAVACVCSCEGVRMCVCVKIKRTKHGWAQRPSRRYVALLWSRPSSRSRSADSTPPLGGGESEKDLGWVEVWAGTQATC